MIRTFIAATAVAILSISFASAAKAQSLSVDQADDEYTNETVIPAPAQGQAQDRLLIVNGNNGHVVYDDGRDDLFCVTRRYVAYYNYHGRPVYRRTIRCR
jgi:hypothetical protein